MAYCNGQQATEKGNCNKDIAHRKAGINGNIWTYLYDCYTQRYKEQATWMSESLVLGKAELVEAVADPPRVEDFDQHAGKGQSIHQAQTEPEKTYSNIFVVSGRLNNQQ